MSTLQIRLLGEFHLSSDGELVTTIHQPRRQSLFAYLLLHCQEPQPRQRVAFLFWPDSSESQARTNLRRALYHIRRALPHADRFIESSTQVQWLPDTPFTLDVAAFETALQQATAEQDKQPDAALDHLKQAVDLYKGELLPDCYDDWILTERERLHQQALSALEQLMQRLEAAREYDAAIRYGRQLLTLDSIHEATYRRLMRLHALNNDRAGALRIYHACADLLQRELDVAPTAATQALYTQLLQEAPTPTPSQPQPRMDAGRLVGRGEEWQALQSAWNLATTMQPHFALVEGEPGIGKSYLVAQLQHWADQQGITTAHARAYATERGLAYAPVVDWLRSAAIAVNLAQLDPVWRTELARVLPELLEADSDLPRPTPLTERWQRQRFFEALMHAIVPAQAPLLLVLDDLQWCDQETVEWLHFLLRSAQTIPDEAKMPARLLLVGTARPAEVDAQHPLTQLRLDLQRAGRITEIALGPLSAAETATLAAQVADQPLAHEIEEQLYQASEGNPLFVVEMMRAGAWTVAETPVHPQLSMPDAEAHALPPKVYAVIEARLTQLSPPARKLANLAAAVGRAFTFDLLRAASDDAEETLVRGLDELWQRRIVHEQGAQDYDFSHDRIRDVAYAEISPVRRRFYHRRIGQALQSIHADDTAAVSGQLGFHYEQSQQPETAVHYYRQAVDAAVELYAFESALYYGTRSLALLAELPPSTDRIEQEIAGWLKLADILIITNGWTSDERKDALEQAYRFAEETENKVLRFRVLQELRGYYSNSGEQRHFYRLSQDAFALAQTIDQPRIQCLAHCSMATGHLQLGEYSASLQRFRSAQEIGEAIGTAYWRIKPRARLVEVLWACGYPEQAQSAAAEGLRRVDAETGPFGQVHEREFIMHTFQRIGDRAAVRRLAAEMTDLCERFGFPNYALSAQALMGWVMAQDGAVEAGVCQIHEAIDGMDQLGDRINRPYFLALLAEAQAKAGCMKDALQTLARAKTFVEASGDRAWEAEVERLTGDVRLQLDATDPQVERCYRSALTTAHHQGARLLELRAATSLARLWRDREKYTAACELLAPIYSWFSEGFETADLRIAQVLLDELNAHLSHA